MTQNHLFGLLFSFFLRLMVIKKVQIQYIHSHSYHMQHPFLPFADLSKYKHDIDTKQMYFSFVFPSSLYHCILHFIIQSHVLRPSFFSFLSSRHDYNESIKNSNHIRIGIITIIYLFLLLIHHNLNMTSAQYLCILFLLLSVVVSKGGKNFSS